MTRRILASFLVVLAAMIAFVEIPLGIELARHEREDFRQTTTAEAQSLAAAAEERLGDAGDQSNGVGLHLDVHAGDAVVVANRRGAVIARFGPTLPTDVVARALTGDPVTAHDRTLASARVGENGATYGTVLLARSSASLDHRLAALTVALVVAAVVALSMGTAVAFALARWVGRPLHGLRRVATAMGAGDLDVRAAAIGPPEVRELAADVNLMAERIGRLLDSQRAMTSDVSHQLRTPLAALRLRLENVSADAPDDMRGDLGSALEEINRLTRLADGLLAVARAENETTTSEPVAVAEVISDRVALWRDLADERSIQLDDQVEPVVAMATPGHLEQVLDNLLANALDVVPTGSSIDIQATPTSGGVLIRVVDHGPGIPATARDRAFQRFSGAGDQRPRSSGLGLAIVAGLMAANHGSARLAETPGGGLTVELTLPASGTGKPVSTDKRVRHTDQRG